MPSDHCQAFVVADQMVRQCKKPVKASGLCYLHLTKIGHFFDAENEKQKKVEVSSIAVFNSEGYLLMGIRNDSEKYTLPGGKADPGESPETCAHRELWEEAGIKIKSLEHLGSGWGGKNGDVKVSVFRGKSDDKPTGENDPDKEVDEWEWIDVRDGLPEEVKGNLHNGKHDITLQILGLLEGETRVELSKSWKHAFVGAMTAASLSGTPAHAQDTVTDTHQQEWTPNGLHEELKPIAHLESTFGKRMKHSPHSKGEYHTAFGAVGLKGVTAHEEYNRTKYLQQIYPDLHDQSKFMDEFKANPTFYNAVATAHWNRLKKLFGNDVNKSTYAWRWGQGRAARADPEAIAASPYVQAYNKIYSNIRTDQVALVNPLEKKVQDWLAKSMDRPATQRLVLYDLGDDTFGHLEPSARHTDDGAFYEATEMADVVAKLRRLCYHGYQDPEGGHPVIFPEFQHLSSALH
jgi:8-oxo-dGTP pyrophosphatase MutT (NUDIX family)